MDRRTLAKRWVSLSGKKRFAYPTKKQAFESFVIRKMRYVENCAFYLKRAEKQWAALKMSELSTGHEKLIAGCDILVREC